MCTEVGLPDGRLVRPTRRGTMVERLSVLWRYPLSIPWRRTIHRLSTMVSHYLVLFAASTEVFHKDIHYIGCLVNHPYLSSLN